MATSSLPLSSLFDVTVSVEPQAPASPQFNQALIVGTSVNIPSVGANSRVKQFTGPTIVAQMIAFGFDPASPEVLAATAYMAQSPQPNYLWVGRQDLTALASITIDAGGTDYVVGDVVGIVKSGASAGFAKVTTVAAGVVTGIAVIQGQQGTGYAVASDLATTGGTGTGLTVNITAIGETPLQAVQACRVASYQWYLVYAIAAVDADNIAITEYAQTATPQMQVFFSTQAAGVLTNAPGNICATLQEGLYNRYQCIYSTTQSGLAPNNAYIAAALMGVGMGRNTGLAGSYFVLAYKQLITMTPEPLSLSQFNTLNSIAGNAYLSYASGSYSWYQTGVTGSGQFFDQILGLDMLASDLQFGEADLLNVLPSLPQTDSGQAQLIHVANQQCQLSVTRGFLAPGTWSGPQIINLVSGQALPNGYLCQSYPTATQQPADRAARKAMPIYIAILLAGSMQSLLIAVYVQQ